MSKLSTPEWRENTARGGRISLGVRIGGIELSVHKWIGCGDDLFVTWGDMIQRHELGTDDWEQAKTLALAKVIDWMKPVNDFVAAATKTPASHWIQTGEADPHGTRYDCERAALALGYLTDDELANGAFMNYNAPLDINRILAHDPEYHSPIQWMTAVKDRIRWLSRRLTEAEAALAELEKSSTGGAP